MSAHSFWISSRRKEESFEKSAIYIFSTNLPFQHILFWHHPRYLYSSPCVRRIYECVYFCTLVSGVVDLFVDLNLLFAKGFQHTARVAIPGWDKLLLVYAVFLIPVAHALLMGWNLLVWSKMRINYPFIFGQFAKAIGSHLQNVIQF
jgi:hypothetical protein